MRGGSDSEGRKARKKGKGPGRSYARLTRAECNSIERMLDRGEPCRVARELGRSPSTVSDEVARSPRTAGRWSGAAWPPAASARAARRRRSPGSCRSRPGRCPAATPAPGSPPRTRARDRPTTRSTRPASRTRASCSTTSGTRSMTPRA